MSGKISTIIICRQFVDTSLGILPTELQSRVLPRPHSKWICVIKADVCSVGAAKSSADKALRNSKYAFGFMIRAL